MKRKEKKKEEGEVEEEENVALKRGEERKKGGAADRWRWKKDSSLQGDLAKLREKDWRLEKAERLFFQSLDETRQWDVHGLLNTATEISVCVCA